MTSVLRIRNEGRLSDQFLDHIPVHIGETEVAALITVGELLVIEAHQFQNRGVQVMHVHLVLNGLVAKSSVAPWTMPPFTPPPAIHMENP